MEPSSALPSGLVCCLVESFTGPGHRVTSLTIPTGTTWPGPTTFHPALRTGAYDYHWAADLAGPDNSGRVMSPALIRTHSHCVGQSRHQWTGDAYDFKSTHTFPVTWPPYRSALTGSDGHCPAQPEVKDEEADPGNVPSGHNRDCFIPL